MVKSGLEQEIIDTRSVPRVSQYRLAAHLSAALALYIGMVSTAIGARRDLAGKIPTSTPSIARFRGLSHLALGMVFFTAVSGAFVAGLDAGLVYNEFPTMGGRLVPPKEELMDERYSKKEGDVWWRNMLENPVTAQFDHRLFVSPYTICRIRAESILMLTSRLLPHSPSYYRSLSSLVAPKYPEIPKNGQRQ